MEAQQEQAIAGFEQVVHQQPDLPGITSATPYLDMATLFAIDAADVAENLPPATLEEITQLAARQKTLEADVAAAELALKAKKGELAGVAEKALPAAMASVNMKEFTLADGSKVTIKEDVKASMRADFKEQAVQWLDDHRLGAIVKDTFTIAFDRVTSEEDKKKRDADIKKLVDTLRDMGFAYEKKIDINAMTLKATVKDFRRKAATYPSDEEEEGFDPCYKDKDFPIEYFVLFDSTESKIVAPAAPKVKKAK